MLIQNQQQPQLVSSPPTQVQIRQNLTLQSIDQNQQQQIALNNQPLSPTHSTLNNIGSQSVQSKDGNSGKQKQPKGIPQLVGLTTIEYAIDAKSQILVSDLPKSDYELNYLQTLDEQPILPNEFYQRIEVQITLPFDMTIEQIELSLANGELFHKYLRILKVETQYSDKTMLYLRSGYIDNKVIELNTCGVSQMVKLVFLYCSDKRPQQKLDTTRKESLFLKTQNVSDKIKNEILPLLHGSDEDIDELDDEVAMISNKKDQQPLKVKQKNEGVISAEDIKIEVKGAELKKGNSNATVNNNGQQNNSAIIQKDESLEGRNFNTLPRNYSENNPNKDQQQLSEHDQQNLARAEQEIFEGDGHNEIEKLLSKSIANIKIVGNNCNTIPAITTLTNLMNNSFLLKKEKHMLEAQEIDFMIGVLMISSKRYTQAAEQFRKIQAFYLQQIELKNKDINLKNTQSFKYEINRLFLQCALIELLIAESMCQANQLNDKLNSLKRMCDLFQGKLVTPVIFSPQIHLTDDPFTTMLKILPFLLKFVLMSITHKKEIVRLASMKILEFVLETKGCSLDTAMVFILKAILKTYPSVQPQSSLAKSESPQQIQHSDSFCLNNLSNSVHEYFQYQNQPKRQTPDFKTAISEVKSLKEPNSGFTPALKNVFNHVLETYISVLSSISSHILHQLFYEVIIPILTSNSNSTDVKVYAIKIAEKIITICQGDLVLNKQSLDYFLSTVSQKSANQDAAFINSLRNLWASIRSKVFANYSQKGLKMLIDWLVEKMSIIAQNADSNKNLPSQILDTQSNNQDISKMEITEEETNQLQQIFDIVSMISIGRKKNEEEANSLIKIKQDYIIELYLLINPLLFWLDFSVEREERFPLFKSVYQTIKDVLENLPPKRVDIDLLQIMIPILQRTTEFLKNNSPSLSMLKFLDIVLRDIKSGNYCQIQPDLQYFFLDMLGNLVNYISYCLYEEVFSVFDKLISMCSDVINEKVLTKCIVALVDKYTMKSKSHKNSLSQFMKGLMEVKVRNRGHTQDKRLNNNNLETEELDHDDISVHSKNNYFEILCSFCFYNNEDPLTQVNINNSQPQKPIQSLDFRSPSDQHDLYIDKLQFFIDSLSLLSEIHINLFTQMIMHPKFKPTLMAILQKGETSLRLKCHEILEVVANYYTQYCVAKTVYELALPSSSSNNLDNKKKQQNEVMEVEFMNQERMYMAQIVVQCVKYSLEQKNDSYLQFNSLILLDFLFQNLVPVPSFQNEQLKDKVAKGSKNNNQNQSISGGIGVKAGEQVIDLETIDINEHTPEVTDLFILNLIVQFEVTSRQYLLLRLNLIFKLWPYVQQALNSAWSNIRSICYGLICSMFKIDIRDFQSQQGPNSQQNQIYLAKLKQIVLPMLMNLLSSKESESKAGGLNILGSFCGLSYDFTKVKISKNLEFFKKNSQFISLSIWQLVFDLQDDWDITIKEASVVLIQLCAPRDAVKYFDKVKREKENLKFANMINRYGIGDQSSRISSARGDLQLHSANSANEGPDGLDFIPKAANDKQSNIMSFLNATDEMSMLLQMDQQNSNPLSGSDIFEQLNSSLQPQLKMISGSNAQRKVHSGSSAGSEEIKDDKKNSYLADLESDALQYQEIMEQDQENDMFVFFVDDYQDEQIQEIISIFRNDFKPPKNLWIEKNPSVAFNGPDYYAEIYSQAIDQFNQQQMQLQQQQQQQLQQQLSSSPKSSTTVKIPSVGTNLVDALEDDLVKKYENERKEKEKMLQSKVPPQQPENFKIFERHYEDSKEEQVQDSENLIAVNKDQNVGSIDAEPYQFLEPEQIVVSSAVPANDKKKGNKEADSKKVAPPQQLQLQIIDEEKIGQKSFPQSKDQFPIIASNVEAVKKPKNDSKKTTDELIEEYERKINKTKSLLEEEKKKASKKDSKQPGQEDEKGDKLTPEFKGKKDHYQQNQKQASNGEELFAGKGGSKKTNPSSYLTDFNKGYLSNQDNAKLIKQINNCFNDNSFNNFNIGPVVMAANSTKHKQKLNKSFENLLAQQKAKPGVEGKHGKKNLSTSPRRGSSSGKKAGVSKSASLNNKKKYLDQSTKNNSKALYNMRDLNFFIKTIEKDLSEKFNKLNLKDFNSMPTTPTSILKKVEEQMRAQAQTKDITKAQLSNTCPNITQVLAQIDQNPKSANNNVLKSSNIMNSDSSYHRYDINSSSQQTPSNISNNNIMIAQSSNSLTNYSVGNALDKFSFSKTQKIDLKDTNKNLFNYQLPIRDGITHRDSSNENAHQIKKSPNRDRDDKVVYANLLKQNKQQKKTSKRSRGSQDKYLASASVNNQNSSSSSYSKLNKSLNNISTTINTKKKDTLSKSMINNFMKVPNMSPSNKKYIQQMVKNQFGNMPSTHQTPLNTQLNNQYSYSSNLLYDYIQTTDQINKKSGPLQKTPIKSGVNQKSQNSGKAKFSEILEISPSSGEKDMRYNSKPYML